MRIFIALYFLLSVLNAFTQSHCGTDEMHQQLFQDHPEYHEVITRKYNELINFTANYTPVNRTTTYIIPVVFHVIHDNGVENISEEQILDQIRILNRDYTNPDTIPIIDTFKPLIADCEIEFRLATKDPNGNCTRGITRHQSSLTTVGDHQVKSIVHWPPDKYLNFYIVRNAAGLAGHALLPYAADSIPNWDGIVMGHNYIGSIGTSSVGTSVVGSHEVGHYLNLQHVWGGNNVPNFPYLPVGQASNCSTDDGVGDTPNTIGNQSCALNNATCGSLDNVQNFMDYSYCGAMFTHGQKARMHATLNSPIANRNNLWSTANLIATGTDVPSTDICSAAFKAEHIIVCVGDTVRISDISKHGIQNRLWSSNGGTTVSYTDSILKIVYNTPGNYDVKLTVSNPFDSDSTTKSNYISVLPVTGVRNWVNEDMEYLSPFPSDKWMTDRLNGSGSWEINDSVGFSGNKSIMYDNFNHSGEVAFESTTIDLSGYTSASLFFRYAYTNKVFNTVDRINTYWSNDCGATWIATFPILGGSLRTKSTTDSVPFVPADNSEWKDKTFSIPGGYLTDNFRFKFVFKGTENGNNIYIDDISVGATGSIGIDEESIQDVLVYPNPTISIINIVNLEKGTEIQIIDQSTRIVYSLVSYNNKEAINVSFLEKGTYFVKYRINNMIQLKKIIKL